MRWAARGTQQRRRQDLNLQIQRTLVFETSAIPGYATPAGGRNGPHKEAVFAHFVRLPQVARFDPAGRLSALTVGKQDEWNQ
jgi:hypothetical protein